MIHHTEHVNTCLITLSVLHLKSGGRIIKVARLKSGAGTCLLPICIKGGHETQCGPNIIGGLYE